MTQVVVRRIMTSNLIVDESTEDDVSSLGRLVGEVGHVEVIRTMPFPLIKGNKARIVMCVHDEGRWRNMPVNFLASCIARKTIVGNAFLIGEQINGEAFVDFVQPWTR